jgi:anti-sigma factor RsiW
MGKGEGVMNCTKIDAKWIVYFDGKATPSERREVETHLASCSACRQRAEEYRAMSDLLDELPQIQPSPSFDAAVRARAAAEPRRGLWTWFVPSPRLAFAVSMLLVLSVWIASRPMAPNQVATPAVAVATPAGGEADFQAVNDLQVLENYDVVSNFDALSDLPGQSGAAARPSAQPPSHM